MNGLRGLPELVSVHPELSQKTNIADVEPVQSLHRGQRSNSLFFFPETMVGGFSGWSGDWTGLD